MADILSSLGISKKRWLSSNVAPASQITQASTFQYGADATTIATLLGSGRRAAKQRSLVYQKWSLMESDAICSSAIMLLVTTALGGHETTGQMVFIEKTPDAEKDKRLTTMVEEIEEDLSALFNRVAFTIGYTGSVFGDAYARIYSNGRGVVDLYTDEMIRPPLVQPFERGSRTVGYAVYVGEKNFERLDVSQMARFKMPRTQWVPQNGVIEKSLKLALTEDDIDNLPIMPSMAGGSLLYNAEESYDNLAASLMGLVGQRWMDSIDEQMVSVNLESMTTDQQKKFVDSITKMLTKSKTLAETAVSEGRPIMERIRHIIPVFSDKQVTTISSANGGQSGRTGTLSIDDVMLHAKLLAGSIGVDLAMLGFSEILSGGLGDGAGFRVSAQAAERSRVIRVALADFFNQVVDIHTLKKYGFVFPANDRPWAINFYGSISALEAEHSRTKVDGANSAILLAQAIQMYKDMGCSAAILENILSKEFKLDSDQAKMYSKILDIKPPEQPNDEDSGSGGGGFGGGFK
ncbi:MAG: hypothetical protein WC856_02330 [Methylococcaceae bacterium]|jgi:hypothetical protein